MNGTIGLAAELGLQLSNVFWDGAFVVLVVFGVFCALWSVFVALCIADVRRARRPQAEPDVADRDACPRCAVSPLDREDPLASVDCTCREDCGAWWCQTGDPFECPWCTVAGCIDSDLCTCAVPCGRGYCKAPAVNCG